MKFKFFANATPQEISMQLLYTTSNTGRNREKRKKVRCAIKFATTARHKATLSKNVPFGLHIVMLLLIRQQ
jgi:hypothetical protein